jgi:hypothetical protein
LSLRGMWHFSSPLNFASSFLTSAQLASILRLRHAEAFITCPSESPEVTSLLTPRVTVVHSPWSRGLILYYVIGSTLKI